MLLNLVPHPDAPAGTVRCVTAQLSRVDAGGLWLEYGVAGDVFLPAATLPARADGLWKTTCFELFVQPAGSSGYFEFNFSPSFQWAAYEFSGYRAGMRELPSRDPEIAITPADGFFWLAVEALPEISERALKIGLSAVIEEVDGTKSYWALAHPPGAPDFHHPDCFALHIPAPDAT